ncbi:MAG: porin [Bryobacteraceae bacterium]
MGAWAIATAAALISGTLAAQSAFEIHGYIQGRFTDQLGTSDRLEIRRARIILFGEPLPKFSYRFQVDVAKKPYLMDASIGYRPTQAFAISVGQMKIPFSAESIIGDDRNSPVSRSRVVLALAPGRDTGVQARDVGTEISGTFGSNGRRLEYAAGVFRGQTFVLAPKVHYQATAGRLIARLQGFSFGADWYGSFSTTPGTPPKRREEVEGEYSRSRANIRAEQIWARDGVSQRRGGYLLGAWKISSRWEVLARSDWLRTNVKAPNTGSVGYIGGANLFLWRHVKVGMNAGAQLGPKPGDWTSILFAQVMTYF